MNLADNALIRRGFYAQLRMPAGAIGIAIAGAVSLGILGIFMNVSTSEYSDNTGEMTGCFFLIFVLQSLFLVLGGTQTVSTQVAGDREIGILDFHRISSQAPWQIALGYLFGMPIRAWVWLAATLPASLIAGSMSSIPVWKLPFIYGVLISMTAMYHLSGLVSGLVVKKAKGAAGTAIGVMMFFNVFFGMCGGGFMMGGLVNHLTPAPTLYWAVDEFRRGRFGPQPVESESFYGFEFPPPLMSMSVQGVISTMLWLAACRRIRNEGAPLLSKTGAILYFLVLLALLFVDTMMSMTSWGLMGIGRGMFGGAGRAVTGSVFPIASLALALSMIVLASPSYGHVARGVRRCLRLGRRMNPLSDGASNIVPAACMVGVTLPAMAVLSFGFDMAGVSTEGIEAFLMAGAIVAAAAAVTAGAMDWAGAQFKRAGGVIVVGILFVLWGIPALMGAAAGMSRDTMEIAKILGSFFPPVGIGLAMDGKASAFTAVVIQAGAAVVFYVLALRARAAIWDHERRMMPSSKV